jgi:hypothetical protein
MTGNALHWKDRRVVMEYRNDAVFRKRPMMCLVPITFEDPNIDFHESHRILDNVLNKMSRNPHFDWLVNIAPGIGNLRPREESDGFDKGNYVATIICHGKFNKGYQDYMKSIGMLHYEEDEVQGVPVKPTQDRG